MLRDLPHVVILRIPHIYGAVFLFEFFSVLLIVSILCRNLRFRDVLLHCIRFFYLFRKYLIITLSDARDRCTPTTQI